MGTGPRQLPAAKLGLGKWLQARRKARRARRKAPPRTGIPPSFLSEALGCQKSRQGTTRRLAAGSRGCAGGAPGGGRSWPRLGAAGPAAFGSCWSGRLRGRRGGLGGGDGEGGTRLPAGPLPSRTPNILAVLTSSFIRKGRGD